MLGDILAGADAADRQRRGGLGQHVAARGFRHAGADRRIDRSRRHGVDPNRGQLQRQAFGQRFERAIDRADDRGAGARTRAEITRHKRERTPGTDVGRTRNTPGAPKFAFHGRANVIHGHRLERPRAQLRGRHNNVVDGPAFAEKIDDAFIAGNIGRDVCRTDIVGRSLQTLSIARRDHHVGALLPGKFRGRKTDTG